MRLKTYATAKISGGKISGAELHYEGSISLGRDLMEAAGLEELEQVHVNGLANGAHWRTYVIAHEVHGTIQLNGPPSRIFAQGEEVVIVRYELLDEHPGAIRLVQLERGTNEIIDTRSKEIEP